MACIPLNPNLWSSLDMNSLQSDHTHSHCHLNGSSVALIVDTQSTPTYYFLWIFLWFLTQNPNPTSPEHPHNHGKTSVQGLWCGRDLALPSTPSPRRETRLTLTFYVKTHWTNNNTAYQFYIGVMGQQEQSQVPCHPFQDANKEPILWREMFPNNFSQGGRANKGQ